MQELEKIIRGIEPVDHTAMEEAPDTPQTEPYT